MTTPPGATSTTCARAADGKKRGSVSPVKTKSNTRLIGSVHIDDPKTAFIRRSTRFDPQRRQRRAVTPRIPRRVHPARCRPGPRALRFRSTSPAGRVPRARLPAKGVALLLMALMPTMTTVVIVMVMPVVTDGRPLPIGFCLCGRG